MGTKNRLIKKLLSIARKHKILTYPVLALVGIISFFSYFFSWSMGAGKRIVAVVMVLLMIVSQSYFLTSSATALVDDENAAMLQSQLQEIATGEVTEAEQDVVVSEETETVIENETETTVTEPSEIVQDEVLEDPATIIDGIVSADPEETTDDEGDVTEVSDMKEPEENTEAKIEKQDAEYKKVQYLFYYPNQNGSSLIESGDVFSSEKENEQYVYNLSTIATEVSAKLSGASYSYNGCYQYSTEWYYDQACTNPVGDMTRVVSNASSANGAIIQLYCKREIMRYQITINPDSDASDEPVSFTTSASESNGLYYIDVVKDGTGVSGSMQINGISRRGYTLKSISVNGGEAALNGQDSATIVFTGTDVSKEVTFNWKALDYTIQYAKNDKGELGREQDVTYDGTERFLEGSGFVDEKEGYTFVGWKIGTSDVKVKPGDLISGQQSTLFQQDIMLYPDYEYNNIEINHESLSYKYKVAADPIWVQARYIGSQMSGSNNFSYELLSGAEELESIGIHVNQTDSGITFTTSGPKRATGSTPVEVEIKVIDHTAPADQQVHTYTILVTVDPMIVTLQMPTDKSNTKVYDGTTKSYLTSPLATDRDDVTVSFSGSHYNSQNVAEANTIILEDVVLNVPAGEDSKNYLLQVEGSEVYAVPGTISKRSVYLKTYAVFSDGQRYIRAGEADPEFMVEEDLSESSAHTGFVEGDTLESLGEIIFSTDRPADLTIPGTYTISASAEEESNYRVKVDSEDKGTYNVIMEDPVKGDNYQISGTIGNADWYINNPAQAEPLGAYDTVRISKDGVNVFDSGSVVNFDEKNYPRETSIYIQLYNSLTGAVTSWKQIEVKVDQTAPEFVSYSISQDGNTLYDSAPAAGGLYFPTKGMLTFGNYFNKTVKVTVTYKDVTSGLSKLQYGLYGEDSDKNTILFRETDDAGYATATFEILRAAVEKAGIIKYRALDVAGNKGEELLLQRDGATEWSVETTGPVVDSFAVKAGEKQLEYVVSGSTEYYANCTAALNVTDATSGIYSVTWNVNGTSYEEERVANTAQKQTTWTFNKDINNTNFPSEGGKYSVYAIVRDNAENEVTTDSIQFYVDDEPPVVNITSNYDTWKKVARVEFNTYDTLSGIKYINVTDADGNLIEHHVDVVEDGISYCYFEVDERGSYQIIVSDKAGNITKEGIQISKVSSETPQCPEVTITPETPDGNDGWYTVVPVVTIQNVTTTTDGAPVDTKYRLWHEGETAYNETTLPKTETVKELTLSKDLKYNLRAWSESETGIQCADTHEYQIKVDTKVPTIDFTTTKGSGSTVLVNFTISDVGSGVDKDSIKVLYGTKEVVTKIEQTDEGYSGSFEVGKTGDYTIQATDIAGNVANVAAFTPMSMKIKAITNISATSATLGANVIKGTFDIDSATLSYRKASESGYIEVDSASRIDEKGNVALSAVLTGLEELTIYAYKVTAVSEAGEVLDYEGYFKTLALEVTGTSITGTARYANNAEGAVTVGLYEGNVCNMAIQINAGDEFTFHNVMDGNYNIIATDGTYSKTVRVMVKDGMIVYPESYIDLVLSGKNTSVVITSEETPNVTAGNMDSIFTYDPINFTDDDDALIEDGGTVEFRLYATLMSVAEVSANEISAMYAVTDKDKVVGAYLDLSLYKIVTDSKGNVESTRVTELANGANISVTIPLGELSGKNGLEVVRIHDTGDRYLGTSLMDHDNSPYTYTVATHQFSTYAVLYDKNATTEVPLTTEKINTTEVINTPTEETENPITTTEESTSAPAEDPADDPDDDPDGNEPDKPNKPDKPRTYSSVGSLKSSGSAKTGDEAPIALMGTMMLIAAAGFVVLRKKIK